MQIDLSTLALTMVSFAVLMVALNYLLFRPVLRHMQERQARVDAGVKAGRDSADRLQAMRQSMEEEEKQLRGRLHEEAEQRLREADAAARHERDMGDADVRRRRDDALIALREEQQSLKQALSRELPNVIDQLGERIDPASKVGA